MHFADREPMDIPPPPTVDTAAEMFGAPVIGFLAQTSLSELGVGTVGSSTNGGPSIPESVAISYTVWKNPMDHDDPDNLADLGDEHLPEQEPSKALPEWILELRKLTRYPSLWEAVMTTRVLDTEWQTPESVLVAHTNHILMNTFREQRVEGEFPGNLDSPVTERHIERVSFPLDGVNAPGMRIDSDPHVYSVGADLGDRIVTAVVARDYLPYVTLAFQTRA